MATQIFRAASLANEFFPRLPGRTVTAGDTWTDTITYGEDSDEGAVTSEWIGTMRVVGDTVYEGMSVTKVTMEGDSFVETEMEMTGMYVTQTMQGPSTGFFLWDPDRRLMVYSEARTSLEGTVDLDMAPAPMDMTASGITRTRLVN